MKISILCSSKDHPVNIYLERWINQNRKQHEISLLRRKNELPGGDLLFLVSCSEIIDLCHRRAYKHVLVIHASDLPLGRGWSPHIWQILEGKTKIALSLLDAKDEIDSGDIWAKKYVDIPIDALWDEINHIIFETEISLMDFAITNWESVKPVPQNLSVKPSYYPKRKPSDSRIDPEKSIRSQFNLIRVSDPDRYPAFFEMHGFKYLLRLEKANE